MAVEVDDVCQVLSRVLRRIWTGNQGNRLR